MNGTLDEADQDKGDAGGQQGDDHHRRSHEELGGFAQLLRSVGQGEVEVENADDLAPHAVAQKAALVGNDRLDDAEHLLAADPIGSLGALAEIQRQVLGIDLGPDFAGAR
ncbi:MAG: hypothetical protein GWN87_27390 [Desulfuromonadales bacterium]|nr:hypothetical protein [Desulfuromonadales bacterium]